ncbi:MAG TPA: 1,4-alpha-glucan branching enzyme, partial [Casimicrobiaceae bacterium]|nr:1,4-alpha-glucan branching enzyme [Casimicrobiaceae bacterium]
WNAWNGEANRLVVRNDETGIWEGSARGVTRGAAYKYRIELAPELCGHLSYRLRAYPCHRELTHPHETGLMRWA